MTSNSGDGNATVEEADRRRRVMADLSSLEQRLRASNAEIPFSQVRDDYPELAQVLFSGRDLRQTNLQSVDLRGIDFRGSDLSGCQFSNARIAGARFERAKVARAALRQAADWAIYRMSWEPAADDAARGDPASDFFPGPGERFSLSPLLPEMIIIEPGIISDPDELDSRERAALQGGRLALAVHGVTDREMVELIVPDRQDLASEETAFRPGYAALSYCRQLTARARAYGLPQSTEVCIPSYRLLHALREFDSRDPGVGSKDFATDLSVADLRLGRGGSEFSQAADGGGLRLFVADPTPGRKARPRPPSRAGDSYALIRPLFLLGEIK